VLAEHSFDRLLLLIAILWLSNRALRLTSGHSADAEKSLFRYASEPFFSDEKSQLRCMRWVIFKRPLVGQFYTTVDSRQVRAH